MYDFTWKSFFKVYAVFLVGTFVFFAAIGYVWMAFGSGMKQHWLTAAVLAVVSVVLAIAFWTDVVVTRLNINKLRVFKPSNERRSMRR